MVLIKHVFGVKETQKGMIDILSLMFPGPIPYTYAILFKSTPGHLMPGVNT